MNKSQARLRAFKNPKMQEVFQEGYQMGLNHGINKSTNFFQYKLKSLADTEGVGPKTLEKFKKVFGKEYFE